MTPTHPAAVAWADAVLAATLFAIDPIGLAGVVVRAGPGHARDKWMALVRSLLAPGAPVRRIPHHIDDDRLLGGLDLTASLAARRPVVQRGLLIEVDCGVAILAMAERIETDTAAKLAAALDQGEVAIEREGLAMRIPTRFGLIALDEGLTPEERPPAALLERLAFQINPEGFAGRETLDCTPDVEVVAEARDRLERVAPASEAIIEGLCAAASLMGLQSCRAPLLALRAARAHASLEGRLEIAVQDAAVAARLVMGPRAMTAPVDADEQPPADGPDSDARPPAEPPSQAPPCPMTCSRES